MGTGTVLFDGPSGTQSVSVWLEWRGGDLLLSSQELGPALVFNPGENEVETFFHREGGPAAAVGPRFGLPAPHVP